MKFPVYNISGEKVKDIELSARVFGVKPKVAVIHQVVVAQLANARQVLANTLSKGEVRGGGKKPWRQKGTGRARHGSIRSPLWRGGGVIFGPKKDRNFSKKVNKKQKQLALFMCLSDKAQDKRLVILDDLKLADAKTKGVSGIIKNLKSKIEDLKDSKKFLLILAENDENLRRAVLNLKNANTILADSLNCAELLKADAVLISTEAIEIIEKHYHKLKQ